MPPLLRTEQYPVFTCIKNTDYQQIGYHELISLVALIGDGVMIQAEHFYSTIVGNGDLSHPYKG